MSVGTEAYTEHKKRLIRYTYFDGLQIGRQEPKTPRSRAAPSEPECHSTPETRHPPAR